MLHDEIFSTENVSSENSAAENTYGGNTVNSENDVCHSGAVPCAAENENAVRDTAEDGAEPEHTEDGTGSGILPEYTADSTIGNADTTAGDTKPEYTVDSTDSSIQPEHTEDTADGNTQSEYTEVSAEGGTAGDIQPEYTADSAYETVEPESTDGTEDTAGTAADESENTHGGNTEDFASMLENYLPTPENTDKLKKPVPQWLKTVAVSFGTCAVMLLIYSLLIVPRIKPSAVISYNSSSVSGTAENITAVRAAADKILPSVVLVSAKSSYRSFFGISTQTANGTGIIISGNGYILTGCSLIGTGDEATVTVNKTNYAAKVVAQDTSKDIAILHIDAENLPAAQFGNSDNLRAGDPVIAVSNILGGEMGASVTRGIICGVNSNLTLQNGNTINLLQTDATTDSGSTGGCIVNENGDIVGMITSAIPSNSEKIAFAIPSNDIKSLAETQTGSGSGESSSGLIIGITGSDADHGVTVESVIADSPAQKSGIAVGDLILKVDGTPVKSIAEINKIKNTHKAGETLVITVYRGGEITDINLIL